MKSERAPDFPVIDEIIGRVVAEAEARRASTPVKTGRRVSWADLAARLDSGPSCATEFRRRAQGAAPFKTNTSRVYDVGEFLNLHGAAFIDACYLGILGRSADPQGFQNFLSSLLTGMRKAEIIARIRLSPEGRAYGAKIRGLPLHLVAVGLFRIPVAGYLAEWILSLISLPKVLRGMRAAEADNAFRRQQTIDEVERALRRVENEAGRGPR